MLVVSTAQTPPPEEHEEQPRGRQGADCAAPGEPGGCRCVPIVSTSPMILLAHGDDILRHAATAQCYNCHTTATPLWRKDDEGKTVCNA